MSATLASDETFRLDLLAKEFSTRIEAQRRCLTPETFTELQRILAELHALRDGVMHREINP
jgi:hypothetical protein